MMKRSSGIKADIEKIKKLRSLQQKATDKLNKITAKAAGKTLSKKKARPAASNKAKSTTKKGAFWRRLLGKKSLTEKRSKTPKIRNKKPGKKGPASRIGSHEGFIFRHFGRG